MHKYIPIICIKSVAVHFKAGDSRTLESCEELELVQSQELNHHVFSYYKRRNFIPALVNLKVILFLA